MLAPQCVVVGIVGDGKSAIESAATLQPDVVLLDLNLPDLSGLEVCRRIASANPRITLIIITGLPDAVIEQLAFAAGASAFIAKTAVATELLPAILQALSGSKRPTSSGPTPGGEPS